MQRTPLQIIPDLQLGSIPTGKSYPEKDVCWNWCIQYSAPPSDMKCLLSSQASKKLLLFICDKQPISLEKSLESLRISL